MMNGDVNIVPAMPDDAGILADMFYANLNSHSGYISHGEVQMGVGKLSFDGEKYVPSVVPESRPLWHVLPVCSATSCAAHSAAFTLRVSVAVSIRSASTPPSTSASICMRYASRSVSNVHAL